MTAHPRENEPVLNLTNVLIVLGIIVTTVGLIYFATSFIERLSEWGKFAVLVLFTIAFVALGRYFETDGDEGHLFNVKGLRWLRVPTALYVLGGVGGFTSTLYFTSMDTLPEGVKVLVTVAAGLALITGAAFVRGRRPHG